ncbi:hypothetical protein [Rhodopirellula europaea]|uniref:Uncharacterized protein n=1 Tax=Rhodopirellula europaea SH398 TaxID=1263868 RepID=M5SAF4_9BACT|nr:hypothetical protein [Rhodopirellula europaea]EMI28471.1 hypothetical protein RESH_00946 [Rhodopirellula europaea SH398]
MSELMPRKGEINDKDMQSEVRRNNIIEELRKVSSKPIPCFILGMTRIHYGDEPETGRWIPSDCLEECRQYSRFFFPRHAEEWKQMILPYDNIAGGGCQGCVLVFGTRETQDVCDVLKREGRTLFSLFDPRRGDGALVPGVRYSCVHRPKPNASHADQKAPPIPPGFDSEDVVIYLIDQDLLERSDEATRAYVNAALEPVEKPYRVNRQFVLGEFKKTKVQVFPQFESAADVQYPEEVIQWEFEVEIHDLVRSVAEVTRNSSRNASLDLLHPGDWETRIPSDTMPKSLEENIPPDHEMTEKIKIGRWAYWWLRRLEAAPKPQLEDGKPVTQESLEQAAQRIFSEDASVSRKTLKRRANEYAKLAKLPG